MRVVFSRRMPGEIEFGIIYGTIAVAALSAVRLLPVLSLAPSCAFKMITGIPCPTCGSTRSLVHLASGDIFAAFMMNPLTTASFIVSILFLLYGIVALLFDLPRIKFLLTKKEGMTVRFCAVALLLAEWIYLYFRLA
jgi:hypothetical protein